MGEEQFDRVQELFLTALELPVARRDAWLREQCGDDQTLFQEVRSLLQHDSPAVDPLEEQLVEAIKDIDRTSDGAEFNADLEAASAPIATDDDQFFSRLAEVGILSADEISELEHDLSAGDPSSTPHRLASKLVGDGKLTKYQATALLRGQPKLLIDKYLILDLIDTGGMGTVFKAVHRPMNRIVAIKMISKHLLASPEQVQRFLREVRVAATLENVNIVRAYDADRFKGFHFLVMEYVRGENLAKIIRRDGPMVVEQAVDCVRQAANGLRYAHGRGIVHRDIKPGNLMRTDGQLIKVLDLGLADVDESFRLLQQDRLVASANTATSEYAEEHLTNFGALLGTASFMAPEQSRDATSADNRSDIYSLGCTLYFLLIGTPPYQAKTNIKILEQHRDSEIPSIRELRADVPQSVDAICLRMLAKEPQDRFQSMGELIAAIEDCGLNLNSHHPYTSDASHYPQGAGTGRHSTRGDRRWIGGVLAVVGFFAIVVAAGYMAAVMIMPDDDKKSNTVGGEKYASAVPSAADLALPKTPGLTPARDPGVEATRDPDVGLARDGNWNNRQFGPERTSFNPYERDIGPANVNRLEVKWKTRHDSTIRWGVCVADGIAYYGDYRGGFHAVEVSTGNELWMRNLDGKHQGHVVVDQVVYVTSVNQLYVFDAITGSRLWTRDPPSGRFGGLIVADGICYVRTDSPPRLHALTLDGGDEVWKTPGGTAAAHGAEVWSVPGGDIAISDGMIYKTFEQTLQAIDTTDGTTQWQITIPEGRLIGPAISAGVVYMNSSAGKIYAYDVTDRKLQNRSPIWTGEIPVQDMEDGQQAPAVGHGKVFVGANNRFYAFDARRGGQTERLPIWETPVEAPFFSVLAPAIANGVVYSTAGYHDLYAFDAESGEVLWNFHTEGSEYPMRSTPSITNGQLYHAATFDFTLYAFSLPSELRENAE